MQTDERLLPELTVPITDTMDKAPPVPVLPTESHSVSPQQSTTGAEPSPVNEASAGASESFMSASVGQPFDGVVVDFIHGANDNYIVYEAQGRLLYQTTDKVPFRRQATDLFYEYMAKAEFELEGAYRSRTRNLIGGALARAFEADSADAVKAAFAIVDSFIKTNTPIPRVFGREPEFIVFMNGAGRIIWDYPNAPATLLPAIAEFEKSIQIAATVLQDTHQAAVKQILANELTVAFRSGVNVPPLSEIFAASRDYIANHVDASARNSYVAASLIVAAIVGAVLAIGVAFPPTLITRNARVLMIGAFAGMIGACISVLQRSSSLVVTQFAPRSQLIVQSIVRMMLGIVFGTVIVVAAKGNIAFGNFKDVYGLFLLAAAAGFSERLIPDLLTNLGKGTKNSSTDGPASAASHAASAPSQATSTPNATDHSKS